MGGEIFQPPFRFSSSCRLKEPRDPLAGRFRPARKLHWCLFDPEEDGFELDELLLWLLPDEL